jgi:hypothetical protein
MEESLVRRGEPSIKNEERPIKVERLSVKTEEDLLNTQSQPDKAEAQSKHRFDKPGSLNQGEKALELSLHNTESSFTEEDSVPSIKSEATEVKTEPGDRKS